MVSHNPSSSLLVLSLALIFNAQIKNWLVGSYKPQVTQQTIVKIKRRKPAMIFKVLSRWTFKR